MAVLNVYDPYPDSVQVGRKKYKLDLAYDNVLRMMDVQAREDLTAADKQEISLALLLKWPMRVPKDIGHQRELLSAIMALFPKTESKPYAPRYLDFHQDVRLIRSAFLRMGIDLTRDKIHFFKFLELLGDLPQDTALARVIDIRQRPLPEPTKYNAKQIAALQEAKARVAIQLSEEERLRGFAESLKQSTILRG